MEIEILSLKEAAIFLKVNRESLRRLAQQGKIRGAFKVGDIWRFRKDVLIGEGDRHADK